MLSFALDPSKGERFRSDFFRKAHYLAGIEPSVEFVFERRLSKLGRSGKDLLGRVQSKSPHSDMHRRGSGSPRTDGNAPYISYATAQWLLNEFTYDEFTNLDSQLRKSGRRLKTTLSPNGALCDADDAYFTPNVLRLGLLTGLISLVDAKVQPMRMGKPFSLFELSSGEYHMYSTILGLGFGMLESSVVLIDEPENSLHPQWQREFMDTVFEICAQTLNNGHLVICTHSPLIVGTALEGSTVVDLTDGVQQLSILSFGASSDELLLSQFGVGSSRNRKVVDTVHRAVSIVERGDFNNEEFKNLFPELKQILNSLSPSDPLVEVIDALLSEDGEE
jgi:hypothetical protein